MPNDFIETSSSLAFIFFLFGMKSFYSHSGLLPDNCQFIDGLGSDEPLGYLPSKFQYRSHKLSGFNFWKFIPDYPSWLRWYIRSPAESQGDLSALSCFFRFGKAYDINSYFSKIPSSSDQELVDFRAFSRGKFHDHQCMIGKTTTAARYFGSGIIYPWQESSVASFCFLLPGSFKYDFKLLKNKLCVRDLLMTHLGWNQTKRGVDLFFDLNEDKIRNILSYYVDEDIYQRISHVGFLPRSMRKRALLELLNLVGYLTSRRYDRAGIRAFLLDA